MNDPSTMEAARAEDPDDGLLVDTADIPGGGCLQLVRHGQDFEIVYGTEQLMGSWDSASEKALATLVCDRLIAREAGAQGSRMLIGGLGMGFTLGAALSALPQDAAIVVAELVPKVVSWASGSLAHLFGRSLDDPRVSLLIRDVHDVIVDAPGGFDAILLDVDNGPDCLINVANERLYSNWGLRAAYAALRPGGMLAIWSAYPDDAFRRRIERAGFAVEEIRIDAEDGSNEPPHVIWLGAAAR